MDIKEKGVRYKNWLFFKFNPKYMIFLRWINSYEYIFEMSNTKDDEKVKYLLDLMEPWVIEKIRKKISPSDPYYLPYDELITVLENTFSNFKGREAANYRYLLRHQFPYESIEHYVFGLKMLYNKCTPYFKSSVNIKYRFIEGLFDLEIKASLRKDKSITLSEAVSIAKQIELAKNKKSGKSSSK